jgi:predicted RNase H-like HicB family nuclease
MSSQRPDAEGGDRDPLSRMQSPQVPVYNCVVIVSPPDEQGLIRARCATVAGIDAAGKSEREALAQVVSAFKATIARHLAAGLPIPWIDPPQVPARGEQQRFIAVHL